MTKWEYCLVNLQQDIIKVGEHYVPKITGPVEAWHKGKLIASASNYLAVFDTLGEAGWEMCGFLHDEIDYFYFKREKR